MDSNMRVMRERAPLFSLGGGGSRFGEKKKVIMVSIEHVPHNFFFFASGRP